MYCNTTLTRAFKQMQPATAAAAAAAAAYAADNVPAADDVHDVRGLQIMAAQEEQLGAVGGAVGGIAVASRDARDEVRCRFVTIT